jgi:hypothetical protein
MEDHGRFVSGILNKRKKKKGAESVGVVTRSIHSQGNKGDCKIQAILKETLALVQTSILAGYRGRQDEWHDGNGKGEEEVEE